MEDRQELSDSSRDRTPAYRGRERVLLSTAIGGAALPIIDLWLRSGGQSARASLTVALLGAATGLILGALAAVPVRAESAAALLLLPPFVLFARDLFRTARRAAELVPTLGEIGLWALAITLALGAALLVRRPLAGRSALLGRGLTIAAGLLVGILVINELWYQRESIAAALGYALAFGGLAAACSRQPGRGLALLVMVLGTTGYRILPDPYPALREFSLLLALGGAALGIRTVFLGSPGDAMSSRAWRRVGMVLALATAMVWTSHERVRRDGDVFGAIASRRGVFADVVRLVSNWTDVDGDDVGSAFLDDDCSPFDSASHPGAHEVPGNGVDDDCSGGDARLEEARAWVRRTEATNLPPPPFRGDIVIVLIDALRHDVIDDPSLQTLRALRDRGTTFERAYTSAPMTSAALPGHLAGRLPSTVAMEWRSTFAATPRDPPRLLVDSLKAAGYGTAIAGHINEEHPYFRADPARHGFDRAVAVPVSPRHDELVDAAIDAFDQLGSAHPRFMWVHTMAVHGQPNFATYRRSLRSFDRALARLVAHIGDDAMVIVTSDHGEEMGEHGGRHHGSSLFDEQVRVPLIIAHPGGRGERIGALTTTRFIAPTLVAMVAPTRPPPGEGPYLCLRPGSCADAEIPLQLEMSSNHLHGLVVGRRKVIREVRTGTLRAYDLLGDPGEQSPLEPTPADLVASLERWETFAFGAGDPSLIWPYRADPSRDESSRVVDR